MHLLMLAAAVAPAAWLMKKVYDLDTVEKEISDFWQDIDSRT